MGGISRGYRRAAGGAAADRVVSSRIHHDSVRIPRKESNGPVRMVLRHCRELAQAISLNSMVTVASSETKEQQADDQQGDPADLAASSMMTNRVVAVLPGTRLIEALRVMDAAGVRHLPVVEGNRCVGLLAETDMLRQLIAQGLLRPRSAMRLTAGDVCRRPAPMVSRQSTRAAAAEIMLAAGSDAVVVLDDERLLGIVTASDLAASLA
jgi:CBS domain-containing protein